MDSGRNNVVITKKWAVLCYVISTVATMFSYCADSDHYCTLHYMDSGHYYTLHGQWPLLYITWTVDTIIHYMDSGHYYTLHGQWPLLYITLHGQWPLLYIKLHGQ